VSLRPPEAYWTGTPKEAIRDNATPKILSLTPDVCKTPIGSATPPIPYNIVAYPDEADKGTYAQTVRLTGQQAMLLRSNTTCCHGDEPGTAKGVKSGTVGDICQPQEHSATVCVEGSPLIRNGDTYYMNKRNTIGAVQWVESTDTYGGKYAPLKQYAFLDTNARFTGQTMTDAPPVQWPKATGQTLTAATKILGILRLAQSAYEVGDMAGKWYVGDDGVMGRTIAEHLQSQVPAFSKQGFAIGKALGAPHFSQDAQINYANDLLSLKAGEPIDFRTTPQDQLLELLEQSWPEPQQITSNAESIQEIKAEEEEYEKARASPLSQSRVTEIEEYRNKCQTGTYNEMKNICRKYGMQAHHMVPDWTLRYGNRKEGIAGKNRIPATSQTTKAPPGFADGQCICVKGQARVEGSEHHLAHAADREIQAHGLTSNPQFTVTVEKVINESIAAMSMARPDCKEQIKNAIRMEFAGVPRNQLLRARIPLPIPEPALSALKSGATL
jgi:hypothetical protein